MRVARGSLIDFETTGIPFETPTHEVVTLGFLSGDDITIIQRRARDKTPFYAAVCKVVQALPRPFYSYNAEFERNILLCELGVNVPRSDLVDLMLPWRNQAQERNLKWPRLDDLISEPEDYFHIGKISGRDVPKLWDFYLSSGGDEETLNQIIEHCLSDLLREAILILRYPH